MTDFRTIWQFRYGFSMKSFILKYLVIYIYIYMLLLDMNVSQQCFSHR